MKKILCSIVASLMIISILACSFTSMAVQPTPTPPPLPETPGIASQRELSPQENQALVNEARVDSVGGALLDWAVGARILGGYTPSTGAEVITDEGDTYRGVALKNAQLIQYSMKGFDQPFYFLSQVAGARTDPKVALIKGPDSIIIYSREGVTVNGKKVAQINSFGASPLSCSLASYSKDVTNDSCTNSGNDVFQNCMGGFLMSEAEGIACGAAVTVAVAAIGTFCFLTSAPTAGTSAAPCMMAVLGLFGGGALGKCPKLGICLKHSVFPNPPELKVTSWTPTGTSQWINISTDANNPEWVNADLYRPQVSVTDDWGPPKVVPALGSISVASGQSVEITATDCNGKFTSLTAKAPELTDGEIATMRKDNPNEEKPASPPQVNQPPAQNPAPSNEITYQGQGPTEYTSELGMWGCPAESFRTVSFALRFNPDGTITYHDCKFEGVALITCDLEFTPTTTENVYEGSNPEAEGFTLTFPSKDLSEVVVTVQKTEPDTNGEMLYCTFKLARINP